MPLQERVGMHHQGRLFPSLGRSREHDQEDAIHPGTLWALHLTAENKELLTEQGIFGDEFSPGAGKIGEWSY